MDAMGRSMRRSATPALLLLAAIGLGTRVAYAEIVEEIVAWVNGDIITKSELEQEEQMMLAEAYRRFSGAALDEQVRVAREDLLDQMIDRKLLIQRAARLFDLEKLRKSLLDDFKQQNKFRSEEEFQRALAQEGLTQDELTQRLLEMYAPQEMVRFEVAGRLAVSDKEIQARYDASPDLAEEPARATVREIVLLADDANRDVQRVEAAGIRARALEPGADFAALAAERSDSGTKKDGGLLGEVRKGDLAPPIEAAAFTTPVGGVSEVIEMPHGFHLVKVEARSEARRKPFEEMKESLRRAIEDERYAVALKAYLDKSRAESDVVVSEAYRSRLKRPPSP